MGLRVQDGVCKGEQIQGFLFQIAVAIQTAPAEIFPIEGVYDYLS